MAQQVAQLASCITAHAWNGSCTQVHFWDYFNLLKQLLIYSDVTPPQLAICPNNAEVHIYKASPGSDPSTWERLRILKEHEQARPAHAERARRACTCAPQPQPQGAPPRRW